jgi:hypothetical protein
VIDLPDLTTPQWMLLGLLMPFFIWGHWKLHEWYVDWMDRNVWHPLERRLGLRK